MKNLLKRNSRNTRTAFFSSFAKKDNVGNTEMNWKKQYLNPKAIALVFVCAGALSLIPLRHAVFKSYYSTEKKNYVRNEEDSGKVRKSEEEWKRQLTPEQYHVAREHGTERAFQNAFWDNKKKGVYKCM